MNSFRKKIESIIISKTKSKNTGTKIFMPTKTIPMDASAEPPNLSWSNTVMSASMHTSFPDYCHHTD